MTALLENVFPNHILEGGTNLSMMCDVSLYCAAADRGTKMVLIKE